MTEKTQETISPTVDTLLDDLLISLKFLAEATKDLDGVEVKPVMEKIEIFDLMVTIMSRFYIDKNSEKSLFLTYTTIPQTQNEPKSEAVITRNLSNAELLGFIEVLKYKMLDSERPSFRIGLI